MISDKKKKKKVKKKKSRLSTTPIVGNDSIFESVNFDSSLLLPESNLDERKPYRVDVGSGGWGLVISDVHVPYHVKSCLDLTFDMAKRNNPKWIILAGDIIDFHKGSVYEQDPKKEGMMGEIKKTRELLQFIRGNFKRSRIIYKLGNHCKRFYRYISRNCPEFANLISFADAMEFKQYGIEEVTDNNPIDLGEFYIYHGDELSKHARVSPVSPASSAVKGVYKNVIIGHHHRTDFSLIKVDNKPVRGYSLGCLCDLSPDYMPVNSHNHGFGMMDVSSRGEVEFTNFVIHDGKAIRV